MYYHQPKNTDISMLNSSLDNVNSKLANNFYEFAYNKNTVKGQFTLSISENGDRLIITSSDNTKWYGDIVFDNRTS